MKVKIKPSILSGVVEVPASKSYAHRSIIAASLSNGISKIKGIELSEDIITTINIMKNFGALITKKDDFYEIVGNNGKIIVKDKNIKCNESGSSIRFLIPLSLVNKNNIIFNGKGKLIERPLNSYYKIFEEQKILYKTNDNKLPLEINGQLQSGIYKIDGSISSQFITGLLFSLPLLEGDSKIVIENELQSKGYVDLTIDILRMSGIEIKNEKYKIFYIKGNQKYKEINYKIEGDYSQAAFWIVAGLISRSVQKNIKCENLNSQSLQGDLEIVNVVQKMNAQIQLEKDFILVKSSNVKGVQIDISQCPDLGPILAVLGCLSEGETKIINAKRLRIKESDRITAIVTELAKMGANIKEVGDEIHIKGVKELNGNVVLNSWNDHRIAMSLAIASTRCNGDIVIEGADCVKKSYPNFWEVFEKMGGIIERY